MTPRREAEPAHVHVALRESVAGNQRVRGELTASRRSQIHHQRQRLTRAADLGEPPRERGGGVDLADAGVEQIRAGALRAARGIPAAMP